MADGAENKCLSCSHLDIGSNIAPEYHTSIDAVRETAGKGCPSCQILLQVLVPRFEKELESSDGKFALVDNWTPYFRVAVQFRQKHLLAGYTELFKTPGTETPYSNIRAARPVSGDTSSDDHLLQALAWIDDCVLHHDHCNAYRQPENSLPHLPKRVIDVTPLDDTGSVRLVESDGQRGLYLCLSHCWGGIRPCVTTHSNLQQRKAKISWTELPKTFQDAVDFVRRLGQRFIWIDSLCILQDDHDDWDQQSIRMAEIYQNSYLTLGATAALDCTGGLYQANAQFRSVPITIEPSGGEPFTLYFRKAILHWNNLREQIFNWQWSLPIAHEELPLLSRAWAFQERVLSPRMLHFGPAELLWECRESFTCECVTGIINYPQDCAKIRYSQSLSEERQARRAQIWRDVVSWYSQLRITEPTDRIAALQGVANQLVHGTPHRIISGLWGGDLIPDLCWHSTESCDKTMPFWFAPTWSWASTYGTMGFGDIAYPGNVTAITNHAAVEKIEFPHEVQDDRAIVRASSLELSISLISGCVTYRVSIDPLTDRRRIEQLKFEPTKDWPEDMPQVLDFWDLKFTDDSDYVRSGETVLLAHLATFHTIRKIFEDRTSENRDVDHALIIRCVDVVAKKFERIGIMRLEVLTGGMTFSQLFEGVERTRIMLV